jgi:hypothetical protein
MKNILLRYVSLLAFLVLATPAMLAQQCIFQVQMHDDFGDGWNGGTLTVSNGATNYIFSLAGNIGDGMDSTVTFAVDNSLPLTLSWAAGSFDYEVSISLFNNNGDLLFEITEPAVGVVYEENVACVACLKPQNIRIENVYDKRAKVRWTPGIGTSIPVGWWVIYGDAGFTPGPDAGDTLYVPTPKATITGLQKKTVYDFYVQQDCGNGDAGDLTGPFSFETYLSDDVGITAVLTPGNSCDLGTETVTIALSNFGANPQSLIPFNYSVNDIPAGVPMPQDGLYTGVLGKDSSEVIEFETQFNFSEPGEYRITVWTAMNTDENTANDTFEFYVVNRLVLPYAQDFETWSGGWYAESDTLGIAASWAFGKPAGMVISAATSGENAWVTNLNGLYNPDERSYLYSPCFDFTDLTEDPVIEFELNYFTETDYDGCWLEMSLDDGANWSKVGAINEGLNWYNFDNTFTSLGQVWAGNSNGWVTARHRLDGLGGESRVQLRFAFSADNFSQLEGIGIDDIQIYLPLAADLAALSVATLGDAAECGLEADLVIFSLANFGSQAQTIFELAYSINGAAPVIESVGPLSLNPDATFEYTFTQPFDSRDGAFDIQCWTILAGDENPGNDLSAVYEVSHLPEALPLQENFENGLPASWVSDAFVSADHNNISQVLATNMYEFSAFSITDLPRLGFVGLQDSLRFDYRITDFSGNGTIPTVLAGGTKLEVQVSIDCGDTYQTVYTIDASNHTPSVGLKRITVGLDAYAGLAVHIRFNATWGAGDFYLDLDNINVGQGSTPVREIGSLTQLTLQPNPTAGPSTLRAAFDQPVDVGVRVLNLVGRVVWKSNYLHTDKLATELNLDSYPDGIYLVQLQVDGEIVTRKLVKTR